MSYGNERGKRWYATCYEEQTTVPQDIIPSLKELEFKRSTIELKADDFKRYKNLRRLDLTYITIQGDLSPDILRPLRKLKTFSYMSVLPENPFNLYLPKSLVEVVITNNKRIEYLDFSSLKYLQILHLFNLSLNSLPKLHPQIPLRILSLEDNPLRNLTREDIVPLCLLKDLSLIWDNNSTLPRAEKYCECVRLDEWIRDNRITIAGGYNLNCTAPPTIKSPEECDKPIPPSILQAYEKCLNLYGDGGGIRPQKMIIIIVVILLISAVIFFIAFNRFFKKSKVVKDET